MTLPLAHLGHYLWIFYVLPVVIVIGGILRTTIKEKKTARAEEANDKSGRDDSRATDTDEIAAPDASAKSPGPGVPPEHLGP
jgi:hypothetical protein